MKKKILILCILTYLVIPLTGYSQEKNEQILLSEKVLDFFQEYETDSIYILFNEQMQSTLPKKQLTLVWTDLTDKVGKLIQVKNHEVIKSEKFTAVLSRCEFELVDLDFKLVLNSENKIAGMFFIPINE